MSGYFPPFIKCNIIGYLKVRPKPIVGFEPDDDFGGGPFFARDLVPDGYRGPEVAKGWSTANWVVVRGFQGVIGVRTTPPPR
jgi:hypothetical protein